MSCQQIPDAAAIIAYVKSHPMVGNVSLDARRCVMAQLPFLANYFSNKIVEHGGLADLITAVLIEASKRNSGGKFFLARHVVIPLDRASHPTPDLWKDVQCIYRSVLTDLLAGVDYQGGSMGGIRSFQRDYWR